MKLTPKSNNTVLLAITILVLAVGLYTAISYLFPPVDDTSNALTYGSSTNVSFTFDPKLSMALSTDNLTIGDIVPGTTKDSNSITVAVSSNTPYGYTLSANVGSNDSTSIYYNTSNLIHEDNTINNTFTSIATNASEETLTTDNTWGYSTSIDNGNTWSTYSGLSNTNKTLLDTNAPAASSTIDFKVAARSAATQASGTYNNIITFYAVGKPEPDYSLYNNVMAQSKGFQTADDLKAEITKDNSGVYEYNASIFGESSDASNAYKIYYYRGILDNSFAYSDFIGGIGSSGDGEAYPNYVILSSTNTKSVTDTCWRIVRTTGSGGVKMIYNGLWTERTCANTQVNAQIGYSSFNDAHSQAVRIGYTYNNAYASSEKIIRTVDELFGTNTNDNNNTDSNIKTIVDNWYKNNLTSFTSVLEPSAGYCGDRTSYDGVGVLQPGTLGIYQYNYRSWLLFGSQGRTWYEASPTLTCGKHSDGAITVDRSKVDSYSTADAATGNGKLLYPVALLTVDEANFAGSGNQYVATYSENSYLRSGETNWLLSPHALSWLAYGTVLYTSGFTGDYHVDIFYGVRPVVSLANGVEYTSGSGTAADPWVVLAP